VPTRLFLILFLAVLSLISCSNKPEKLAPEADNNARTDEHIAGSTGESADITQELHGVKYSESKEGRLQWELVAESVRQSGDGPTDLEDVTITYYSDDGRITVLTADSGQYESVERNAVLRGNVIVKTSDGNSLMTEAIKWNQQAETLRSEDEVIMQRGGSMLKGSGFELSPYLETFRIYNVEGTIRQGDMDL